MDRVVPSVRFRIARRRVAALLACALGLFTAPASLAAWTWPERAENLQVLPKDFDAAQLRSAMFGFSSALGVRCTHCHVGQDGQPLETFDFASDEKPEKRVARRMVRMMREIGGHLEALETEHDTPVRVQCATCHAGRPRPATLAQELGTAYASGGGVEAALDRYDGLRERYLVRGAYDFGEASLDRFGYRLLQSGDTAGAVAIFERNVSLFPDSANAHDSLSEGYESAGDRARAVEHAERALERNPKLAPARKRLARLGGSSETRDAER